MFNIYGNFKRYAKCGAVPAVKKNGLPVPENSFYKSVYYIDSYFIGPIKDMLFGVDNYEYYSYDDSDIGSRWLPSVGLVQSVSYAAALVVLNPLCLAVAYLSYWPKKLTSQRNTESLTEYSARLSRKVQGHSKAVAQFVNTVLSYIFSAVVWAAAFVLITPLVLAYDAVKSKFSEVKPEQHEVPSNGMDNKAF